MDKRQEDLTKLKVYTEGIDNELTMILQSLQWDRKRLLEAPVMMTCRYDSNHKVPPDKHEGHEKECFLRQNGYTKEDQLLPEPLDPLSNTLVKLSKENIEQIIGNASISHPTFKRVISNTVQGSESAHPLCIGCRGAEPLSLERLQCSYSADERRAIHDAVVSAVPSCHDLTDLALLSGGENKSSRVILSRMEILIELRNMRRRRTKYRVAAKTRNYSDVLRDVIKTQMEHYNDGRTETTPQKANDEQNRQTDKHNDKRLTAKDDDRYSYEQRKYIMPVPKIEVKSEGEDSTERRDYSRNRYDEERRDRRDRDRDRHRYHDRSNERKQEEHSRKRRHDRDSEKDHNHKGRPRDRYYEENERKRHNESHKEYQSENRSRYQDDNYMHQVKIEPDSDDDRHDYRAERSKKRKHETRDKYDKQKDRTERNNYINRRKDRGRSRDRTQDYRYVERPIKQERGEANRADRTQDYRYERPIKQERGEALSRTQDYRYEERNIKQERDDTTRDSRSYHEKDRAKDKDRQSRHEKSHKVDSSVGYSHEKNQEKHARYYARPEEVYDPNKKIKEEK